MGTFPLVNNCRNFMETRPPLVIFLICLISSLIVCVSFSFYVQQNDVLIDTDVLSNWNNLLEFFNKEPICTETNATIERHVDEEIEFTTEISINRTYFQNVSSLIQVYYKLEDWKPNCLQSTTDNSSLVFVKFNFEPVAAQNDRICALIRGPRKFLPVFSRNPCNFTAKSTTIRKFNNWQDCGPRQRDVIRFGNGKMNKENFAVFLNEVDRNEIYVHLMWLNAFIFLSIIIIAIYALFHQKQSNYRHGDEGNEFKRHLFPT